MYDPAARWISRGVALLVLGPIAAWAGGRVRAIDGSDATTLLTGGSLGAGLLAAMIVWGCLLVGAGLSARLADRHEAVLNAGFILAWVAWTQGRLGDVYRLAGEQATGVLVRLACEGAILGLGVVLALWVGDRLAGRAREREGLALGLDAWRRSARSKPFVPVFVVSAALAVACAYLFARHDLPGQAIGSAFLGGIAGGVFGTLVYQSILKDAKPDEPGVTAWFMPILLGVMVCGVIAPLAGMVMPGAGGLVKGVAQGSLPGWVLVSPSAWMAGALIGVPAGISFLQPKAAIQASGLPGSVVSHQTDR